MLIHGYASIDHEVVWATYTEWLPELVADVAATHDRFGQSRGIWEKGAARGFEGMERHVPSGVAIPAGLAPPLENQQYARQDSNLQPSVPKTDALSN